jgi:hypothetical protein
VRSPTLFSDSAPLWVWWYVQDLGEAWCGWCWVVLWPSLVTRLASFRSSLVGFDFLDVLLVDLGGKKAELQAGGANDGDVHGLYSHFKCVIAVTSAFLSCNRGYLRSRSRVSDDVSNFGVVLPTGTLFQNMVGGVRMLSGVASSALTMACLSGMVKWGLSSERTRAVVP